MYVDGLDRTETAAIMGLSYQQIDYGWKAGLAEAKKRVGCYA